MRTLEIASPVAGMTRPGSWSHAHLAVGLAAASTAVAVVATIEAMLPSPAVGRPGEWQRALAWQVVGWWSWIAATPTVLAVSRRALGAPLPRLLVTHVVAGLALAIGCSALQGGLRWMAFDGFHARYSFAQAIPLAVIDLWAVNLLVYGLVVGVFYAFRAVRLEALLVRAQRNGVAGTYPSTGPSVTEHFGDVIVDPARHEVTRAGRRVPLRPKEYELLVALLCRRGAVATRTTLLREVWGYADGVKSRTVDAHIVALRSLLEPDPARPRHLLTVRHYGYRLDRNA